MRLSVVHSWLLGGLLPAALLMFCLACSPAPGPPSPASRAAGSAPGPVEAAVELAGGQSTRLAVVVVIDQFRGSELADYDALWHDGIRRLLTQGRWYTHAVHGHGRTETASGHATIATGVHPRWHGVVDKRIYDPDRDEVLPVCRFGSGPCDPFPLAVPTIGDRLKQASPESKVVALADKDYAAMLMAGERADLVAWTQPDELRLQGRQNGHAGVPDWLVARFEHDTTTPQMQRAWSVPPLPIELATRPDDGPGEIGCGDGARFPHELPPDATGEAFANAWRCTPQADRTFVRLALESVQRLGLGADAHPDLLMLSLGANDVVGHQFGYESLERVAVQAALDQTLGELLRGLRTLVPEGLVLALTADHGVSARLDTAHARGVASGRVAPQELENIARKALTMRLGANPAYRPLVAFPWLFLRGVAPSDRPAATAAVVEALRSDPRVHAAWPSAELDRDAGSDPIARVMREGVHATRAGDITIALRESFAPMSARGMRGAEHGTPWWNDRHVPALLWGDGVVRARIDQEVRVIDVVRFVSDRLGLPAHEHGGTPLP